MITFPSSWGKGSALICWIWWSVVCLLSWWGGFTSYIFLPLLTSSINEFVVSHLIPCVNLKYLGIGHVAAEMTFPAFLPKHSIQMNASFAGTRPTAVMMLCTAQRPDGQPIFDFGPLSKITVSLEMPNQVEASQDLFRRCHVLTNVHISHKWYLHHWHDHQYF